MTLYRTYVLQYIILDRYIYSQYILCEDKVQVSDTTALQGMVLLYSVSLYTLQNVEI